MKRQRHHDRTSSTPLKVTLIDFSCQYFNVTEYPVSFFKQQSFEGHTTTLETASTTPVEFGPGIPYMNELYLLVMGRYWVFSSVPVLVLKPRLLRFRGTGSRTLVLDFSIPGFQGVICIFLILVLVRFHFSTISPPNHVKPKALVLEPELTGT